MSEAPKVIWACDSGVWFGNDQGEPDEYTKYHHDNTVTTLQAKVARLEAALEIVAEGDPNDYTDNYLIARNALRAIALDTTTPTCDNTREGDT